MRDIVTNNQFSFVCPIFNAETKMASCLTVRTVQWQGKPMETRRGCRAAMACGKCPAAEITSKTIYITKEWPDAYFSDKPVVGKLQSDCLEMVRPRMMRESVMQHYQVTPAERALLEDANERIDKQLLTAPGQTTNRPTYSAPSRKKRTADPAPVTVTPPPVNTAAATAARTGDLSAALNAA